MRRVKFRQGGILKLLKKPHKASVPDSISTSILTLAAEELALELTELFQTSVDRDKLPKEWKDALISPISLISPIYKKGDRNSTSNYRPVSFLCVICKKLEHIMHSLVMKHFDEYQILTDTWL